MLATASSPSQNTTGAPQSASKTPFLVPSSNDPAREADSAGTGAASFVGPLDIVSRGFEDFRYGDETPFLMHVIWTDGVIELLFVLPETCAKARIDALGMSISVKSRTEDHLWHTNVTARNCDHCRGFYYRHHCEHQRIADRVELMAYAWLDRRAADARRRDYDDAMDMKHWEEVA